MDEAVPVFKVEMLIWLLVAALGGLVVTAIRSARPAVLRQLAPPQRQRAVPWTGFEVLAAFFLAYLYLPLVAHELVTSTALLQHVYGADFDAKAAAKDPAKKLDVVRWSLWATAVAFPLQLPLIFALLRWAKGTQLYQLGLSGSRAFQNAVLGWSTWLFAAPAVLFLNFLLNLAYHGDIDPHPLTELRSGTTCDFLLMVFLAVISSPILEEFLFRGILQPWACRRSWAADVLLVMAFAVALLSRYETIHQAFHADSSSARLGAALEGFSPALFVLAMIPGYIFIEDACWRWLPIPHVARTIYSTSLLFASFHATIWPSPIPLFPLSLALGFLAFRTQSLIGPILCHALFNLISAIVLLLP